MVNKRVDRSSEAPNVPLKTVDVSVSASLPVIYLPDASFLLDATFTRDGFDLVITNPEGEVVIVHDYFSFHPPPNLMLENGVALSPEMVAAFMHIPYDGVMFAGPATSANALEKIGEVTIALGDVKVRRMGADGQIEEVTLKRGDALYKGDEIITGGRAYVKAKMLDGTRFNLGKNARASLDDYQYDEGAQAGKFEATVLKGGFHYASGKIGKFYSGSRSHSKISTPSAVIGIRGSEAEGVVASDGQLVLRHISGSFEVADVNGNVVGVLDSPENALVVFSDGSGQVTPLADLSPALAQALQEAAPPPDTPGEGQEEDSTEETEDTTEQTDETGQTGEGEEGEDDPTEGGEEGTEGDEGEEGEDEDTEEEEGEDDEEVEEEGAEEEGDGTEEGEEGDPAEGEETGEEGGQGEEGAAGEEGTGEAGAGEEGAGDEGSGDDPAGEEGTGEESGGEEDGGGQDGGDDTGDGDQTGQDDTGTEGDATGSEEGGGEEQGGAGETGSGTEGGDSAGDGDSEGGSGEGGSESDSTERAAEGGSTEGDSGSSDESGGDGSDSSDTGRGETGSGSDSSDGTDSTDAPSGSDGGDSSSGEGSGSESGDSSATTESQSGDSSSEGSSDTGGDTSGDSSASQSEGASDSQAQSGDGDSSAGSEGSGSSDGSSSDSASADGGDTSGSSQDGASSDSGSGDSSSSSFGSDSSTTGSDSSSEGTTTTESNEGTTTTTGSNTGESTTSRTEQTEQTEAERELPPDNPPDAQDDRIEISAASTIDVTSSVLANDSDPDEGQSARLGGIVAGARQGTVTFDGNGITYTPSEELLSSLGRGKTATDTFSYQVRSGDLSDVATVTIIYVGNNELPVAGNDTDRTDEDTPLTLDVLANDSDSDPADELTITGVSGAKGEATVSGDGKTISYNPPQDLSSGTQVDTFTYTVSDGKDTSTATISITVEGINDPPVINTEDPPVQVDSKAAVTSIPLNAIFKDVDLQGELTVKSLDTAGTRGKVTIGSVLYEPGDLFDYLAEGETATDSFGITVSDEIGAEGSGRYTVTIVGRNDEAVILSEPVISARTGFEYSYQVDAIDIDESDLLTYSATGLPPGLSIDPLTGLLSGIPEADSEGEYNVVIEVTDGIAPITQAFTLTVTADNRAPEAQGDLIEVFEDEAIVVLGNLLANDVDLDVADQLEVTDVNGLTTGSVATDLGELSWGTDGAFTYSANNESDTIQSLAQDQTLTDTFFYGVSDGNETSTSVLTVTIVGTNDLPETDFDLNVATEDDETSVSGNVLDNDADIDTADVLLVDAVNGDVTGTVEGAYGTLSWGIDGGYAYTVDGVSADVLIDGETGTDSFFYLVSDGSATVTEVLTISIIGINDAPIAEDDSAGTTEDALTSVTGNLLGNDSDVDSGIFVDSVNGANSAGEVFGSYGSLFWDFDGFFDYLPDSNLTAVQALGEGETAVDTFSYTISDGDLSASALLEVVIVGENDAPTFTSIPAQQARAGDEYSYTPAFTDVDASDSPRITGIEAPSFLTIDAATGTISGTPSEELIGEYPVSFTISDGIITTTQTFTLKVVSADSPPVGNDDVVTIDEDNAAFISVLANDTDPDTGQTLTVTAVGQPANGVAILQADGSVLYEPDLDFNGVDGFSYTVSDSSGQTSDGSVIVNVLPVNDEPFLISPAFDQIGAEGEPLSFAVGGFTDVEGDQLTLSVVGLPQSLTFDGGSTVSGTPAAGDSGTYTVTVTATDTEGATGTDTFSLFISGPNLPPTVVGTIPDQTATEEQSFVFFIPASVFEDTNGDELFYTVSGLPDGIVFDGLDTISGIPDDTDVGTFTIAVAATDGFGSATTTFTLDVAAVNDAPILFGFTSDQFATEGLSYAYTIPADHFFDPDDETLTYSAFGLPPSFTFDGSTISGIPDDADVGSFSVTITATDSNGETATETFPLTVSGVNDPPVVSADVVPAYFGEAVTFDLLANDSDPDGDTLFVSFTPLSALGGTLTDNGDGTVTYVSNPLLEELDLGEPFTDAFAYAVSDGSATATSTVALVLTSDPDVAKAQPDSSATDDATPIVLDVLINDYGTLPLTIIELPETSTYGATLTLNPDDTIVYDPTDAFLGYTSSFTANDGFSYVLKDALGVESRGFVTITTSVSGSTPVVLTGTQSLSAPTTITDALTQNTGSLTLNADVTVDGLFQNWYSSGQLTLAPGVLATFNAGLENVRHIDVGSGASLVIAGGRFSNYGSATLSGDGIVDAATGSLYLNGKIQPGGESGFGTLTFIDNSDTTTSSLDFSRFVDIEINVGDGTSTTTTNYDLIYIIGEADIEGQLVVKPLTGYTPEVGDAPITVVQAAGALNGQFSEFFGLNLGAGKVFEVTQSSTSITLNVASVTGSSLTGATNEIIVGSAGDDSFDLNATASTGDTVYGGDGNDTFLLGALDFERIDGEGGLDRLEFSTANPDLSSITNYQVDGIEYLDIEDSVFSTLTLTSNAIANMGDADFSNPLRIDADPGDHVVISADFYSFGGDVNPTLDTNDGKNRYYLSVDGARLDISENATVHVVTLEGSDVLFGSSGADSITGTAGNDWIVGRTGADTISAGAGKDVIMHGPAYASATGGDGIDTLMPNASHILDLTGNNPYSSIEIIGLDRYGGSQTLYIDMDDVAQMGQQNLIFGDDTVQVIVKGTIDDYVFLNGQNLREGDPAGITPIYDSELDYYRYDADLNGDGEIDTTLLLESDLYGPGVNHAPDAERDAFAVTSAGSNNLAVLGNDFDRDPGDTFTITAVSSKSAYGVNLSIAGDGSIVYDPSGLFDFLGYGETRKDSFSYTLQDSNGSTSTGYVTVTVTADPSLPYAFDDTESTTEGAIIRTGNVLTNDLNASAIVDFSSFSWQGANVIYNGDGTFTYDPGQRFDHLTDGQTITDQFSYTIQDGSGNQDTGVVKLTITGSSTYPGVTTNPFVLTLGPNLAESSDIYKNSGTLTITGANNVFAGFFENDWSKTLTLDSGASVQFQSGLLLNGSLSLGSGSTVNVGYRDPQINGEIVGSGTIDLSSIPRVDVDGDPIPQPILQLDGRVDPGTTSTASTIAVTGDVDMAQNGTIRLNVLDVSATSWDTFTVSGNIKLKGTLDLGSPGAINANPGDVLANLVTGGSISGEFSTISGQVADTVVLDVSYGATAVSATAVTIDQDERATTTTIAPVAAGNVVVAGGTADVFDLSVNTTGTMLFGQAGDDVFSIADTAFKRISGGPDYDKLIVNGVDLSTLNSHYQVDEVELIDLTDGNGGDVHTFNFTTLSFLETSGRINLIADPGDSFVFNQTNPDGYVFAERDSNIDETDKLGNDFHRMSISDGDSTITLYVSADTPVTLVNPFRKVLVGTSGVDSIIDSDGVSNELTSGGGADSASLGAGSDTVYHDPEDTLNASIDGGTDYDRIAPANNYQTIDLTAANPYINFEEINLEWFFGPNTLILNMTDVGQTGVVNAHFTDGTTQLKIFGSQDDYLILNGQNLRVNPNPTGVTRGADNEVAGFATYTDGSGNKLYVDLDLLGTATNHAPVALDDRGTGFTLLNNASLTTGNVLVNDLDPDPGDTFFLQSADTTSSSGVSVVYNGDGTFTYNPGTTFSYLTAGATATDFWNYTISDGTLTTTGRVFITITGAAVTNSAPTGTLSLSGAAQVTGTVLVDTSGVFDPNDGGPTISPTGFQWYLNGTAISGATASSYSPTVLDVGGDLSVRVDWTDADGFSESMFSDKVEVQPQNPNISGTTSYNLVPSFNDYLSGSTGSDTLTLTGAAQNGDFVNLGNSFDQLVLDGNYANDIQIENVESLSFSTASAFADTVTQFGNQTGASGLFGSLGAEDSFVIKGSVSAENESTTLAGSLAIEPDSQLELQGSSGSIITLGQLTTNKGYLVFDGQAQSTLTVSSGTVANEKNIISKDSSTFNSSPNRLDADVQNTTSQAEIIVEHNLDIVNGSVLDVGIGRLTILGGETLKIDNSTLRLGSSSDVKNTGTGSATISFVGASTLEIQSGYVISSSGLNFDFSSGSVQVNSFGGPATLTLNPGISLQLTSDAINANFSNSGTLLVSGGGNQLNGTVTQVTSGVIALDSSVSSGASALTLSQPFANSGVLRLDNADASDIGSQLTGVVTLTNNASGVIAVLDDDNSLSTSRHQLINVDLLNNGEVNLFTNLDLTKAGVNVQNNGKITLEASSLQATIGGNLVNNNGATIKGAGTLTFNNVTQNGVLMPEGPDNSTPSPQVITISGNLTLGSTGKVELDIFSLTSRDQVVVSGTSPTLTLQAGNVLVLNFRPGHGIAGGQTIQDVLTTTGSISGTLPTVQHNLSSAYTVNAVQDGATIDISISAAVDRQFAVTSGDWATDANWSGSSNLVPTATDHVLIGSTTQAVSASANGAARSLTILSGSSLSWTAGTLTLSEASSVFSGATLTINTSAAGTAALAVNQTLSVDGTLSWKNGNLNGDTTDDRVVVNGTLDVVLGNSQQLNLTLQVDGTGAIDAVGKTLSGTGSLEVSGSLDITRSPTFSVPLNIKGGGNVLIKGDTGAASVTMSADLTNDGSLTIDSAADAKAADLLLGASNFTNNDGGYVLLKNSAGTNGGLEIDFGDGALFTNQGSIELQADATFRLTNSTFDMSNGSLIVNNSVTLTAIAGTGATTKLGPSSHFGSDGTIALTGAHTFDITGDTFLDTNVQFDVSSAGATNLTGTGPLSIGNNTTFSVVDGSLIDIDDLNSSTTDLLNYGTLNLLGNGISVQSSFDNHNQLNISGGGATYSVFSHSMANFGTMKLEQNGASANRIEINDPDAGDSGTLTNHGTFNSTQTGSDTLSNILRGTLVNQGTLGVQYSLTLNENSGAVTHDNFGTINLGPSQTLTLGANNSLTSHVDAKIEGSGTLDVSASGVTFLNDGMLLPGGSSTTGTMTINLGSSMTLGAKSEVVLDLGSTLSDVLAFTGSAPTLGGRLRLNDMGSFGSFTVLTSAVALAGSFSVIEGTETGPSSVIDVTQNTNNLTVQIVTPTVLGTSAPDISAGALVGTVGVDVVYADAGDDDIDITVGSSTGDTVFAGTGNDAIATNADFKRIVGGDGIDEVELIASLDYRSLLGHQLEWVEVLNIDSGSAQTIQLDAAAIAKIVDGSDALDNDDSVDTLAVIGDNQDLVILYGDYDLSGNRMLDIRNPGTYEKFDQLLDSGTNSALLVDEHVQVQVERSGGEVYRFGSSANDTLSGDLNTSTADKLYGRGGNDTLQGLDLNDILNGGDGDDILDGGSGADQLFGEDGNDQLHYDVADTQIDGGDGLDTLLGASGGIDLSNVQNIEKIDITDASPTALSLSSSDLFGIVGDNSLDELLNDGLKKIIIDGDTTDTVTLDGNTLWDINGGLSGGLSSTYAEESIFGGTYIRFTTSAGIDVYVHANLVDDTPM